MPGDLRIGIRLDADGKGFVGEMRLARRELDKLAGGTGKAGRATAAYARASQRGERATRDFGKSLSTAHGRVAKYAGAFFGAQGLIAATRGLGRHADAYTRVSNAVRLATNSAGEQARVQTQLFDIAQRTRAPIGAVANLYQKLSLSQSDLGASSSELLGVIEGVGQALVISGTDAGQASGALLQLSQALGGGVVRAEEFNSVLEGAPQILRAAAKHIDGAGGSAAKLRQIVNAGELSSRNLFNALQAALPNLAADFEKTTSTIDQGIITVNNAMTEFVGRLDETVGASSAVSAALEGFAGALDSVDIDALINSAKPLLYIAGGLAAVLGIRAVAAMGKYSLAAYAAAATNVNLARSKTAAAVAAGKMTTAMGRARLAVTLLGRAIKIASGPAGWLLLAGGALASLAFNTRETGLELQEYNRILAETDASNLTPQSTAAAAAMAKERLELAKLNRDRALAARARFENPDTSLDRAFADLARRQNPARYEAAAAAHSAAVRESAAAVAAAERDLATALRRQGEAAKSELTARYENLRDKSTPAGPLPEQAAPAVATAAVDAKNTADEEFRRLRQRLQTERQAIEGEYADRMRIIQAAESAGEEERTALALRALADRNSAIAAMEAADRESRKNAQLEFQRQMEAQKTEALRAQRAQQLVEAQGFDTEEIAQEAAHRRALADAEFADAPEIAGILKRQSDFKIKLDRNEEVSAGQKSQHALALAHTGLAAAARHSKTAFKLSQVTGIATALINTYEGITKALASSPPPFNFIAAAAVGAAGLAQVAAIRSQQPPQGFALGGVVDRPTFFSARGVPAGVAGEAGPEAILPLRRGPGGRLGVSAGGGGMRAVTVTVNFTGGIVVQPAEGEAQGEAAGRTLGENLRAAIVPIIRKTLGEEQRPGGLLNPTRKAA